MGRASNAMLVFILVPSLIISILYIILELEHFLPQKDCLNNFAEWIISYAIFVFLLSFMGLIGLLCRLKAFFSIFMWILCLTIIATIFSTIFLVTVLPIESAESTYKKTENGYWLDAYSPTLQEALVNKRDWFRVKRCLMEIKVCDTIDGRIESAGSPMKLPSLLSDFLERGCCYPPKRCRLVEKNMTHWVAPEAEFNSTDGECKRWSEIYDGKCYECKSCKAAYIAKFHKDWDDTKLYYLIFTVFLLITICLSVAAFKDVRDQHR